MKRKYKARTLEAASRRVNNLRVHRKVLQDKINSLYQERFLLAKLASERPEFNNPFDVAEAKKLRDMVLSDYLYEAQPTSPTKRN